MANIDDEIERMWANLRQIWKPIGQRQYTEAQMVDGWLVPDSDFFSMAEMRMRQQPSLSMSQLKSGAWALELPPHLAEVARQVRVRIDQQIFTSFAESTTPDAPAANLTMEDVLNAVEILRNKRPSRLHIQEIWFVDTEPEYYRFQDAFEAPRTDPVGRLAEMSGYAPFPLSGIPVCVWNGRAELDACKTSAETFEYLARAAHVPLCGLFRGIWLKLRDYRFPQGGPIQQVENVDTLIAAFKASQAGDNSG